MHLKEGSEYRTPCTLVSWAPTFRRRYACCHQGLVDPRRGSKCSSPQAPTTMIHCATMQRGERRRLCSWTPDRPEERSRGKISRSYPHVSSKASSASSELAKHATALVDRLRTTQHIISKQDHVLSVNNVRAPALPIQRISRENGMLSASTAASRILSVTLALH